MPNAVVQYSLALIEKHLFAEAKIHRVLFIEQLLIYQKYALRTHTTMHHRPIRTNKYKLEKQSETADLRQRHVVCQVASSYLVWQRFPLCPI